MDKGRKKPGQAWANNLTTGIGKAKGGLKGQAPKGKDFKKKGVLHNGVKESFPIWRRWSGKQGKKPKN